MRPSLCKQSGGADSRWTCAVMPQMPVNWQAEADVAIYRNIKHAFYQPAENEMICLVHFHLINPIMVAKKKTQDVQCFAEVMDSVQTLDAGRRSMYDPDEIEEEQREREQRNKV